MMLSQRAGLQLKQCYASGRLLSHSLCTESWDDEKQQQQQQQQGRDVHLIVLIHGWLGSPKEMDALKESLLEQSQIRIQKQKQQPQQQTGMQNAPPLMDHRVVVHSIKCNDGKTTDGIEAGGRRVATEINEVVREIRTRQSSSPPKDDDDSSEDGEKHDNGGPSSIRLSIVGNSLGGLYGRFALSEIDWNEEGDGEGSSSANDENDVVESTTTHRTALIPHYFVTTATPHLGCGYQQTYLPLPRFVERPIGNVLLRTGQDLFRLVHGGRDDIIQEMAFSPIFTDPLSKFRKRLAYANVHGTDFQVPVPTAAFWAPTDSVHYTVMEHQSIEEDQTTIGQEENVPRGIALTLTTPVAHQGSDDDDDDNPSTPMEPKLAVATCAELSQQLDHLGWTKVLVDVRHEMPVNLNGPSRTDNSFPYSSRTRWTSKELLQEFDTGRLKSLPMGHMMMVANAKNELYRKMNKGGVPIMDYLAKEMINSI